MRPRSASAAPALTRAALSIFASALLALPATSARAAEDDAITPYRPSASTPAQLPVPGQLEFELGGLHTKNADVRRDSLPYQFKLAFNRDWGVLIGGEAVVSLRDPSVSDSRMRGLGDTNLVLKRAFTVDEATAFGLELGVKIPTARNVIGSGSTDLGVNGIVSRDFGSLHLDANLNFTHIGGAETGTGSVQTGLSTSFSHPLTERLSATAELSGLRRSGTASTALVLLALAYSPTKRLTMDIGVARGLNPGSPNLAMFAGLVIPVARLW